MKRLFLLITIVLFSAQTYAQGESTKREIYFGYGIVPTYIQSFNLPHTNPIYGDSSKYTGEKEKLSGTISIGYAYHLSDNFALGLNYSYGTAKRELYVGSSVKLADMKNDIHTIMLTGKCRWLNTGKVSFYSRASVGAFIFSNSRFSGPFKEDLRYLNKNVKNQIGFAWQVSPVGLDWTYNKNIGFFMEGGIGYSGCAIAGIRVFL